jgi:hypothetical protein
MPLIPNTKIIASGNKRAAMGLVKFATSQLAILERQMSYQKINEGRRIVSPFNGVTVECISKYGKKEVRIHVAPVYVSPVSTSRYVQPVIRELPTIEDDRATAEYFFRLKYRDPSTDPYEVIGDTDYSQLDMDRLMVWELGTNGSSLIPGESVLKFDIDVVNRIVYSPVGLSVEEEATMLATADSYITVCPSNTVPSPTNCLEDFALSWFTSGGLSDPVSDSVVCAFTAYNVTYKIDDLYLCDDAITEFCPMIPLYPSGIDAGLQSSWITSWCAYPLTSYEAESWFGIATASAIIGDLSTIADTTDPVVYSKTYIMDHPATGWPIYYWHSSSESSDSEAYLQSGTWFTNKSTGGTSFNCFFSYLYSTKVNSGDIQYCAPSVFDGTSPYDPLWTIDLNQGLRLMGLVTPLENIDASDLISVAYPDPDSMGCSECPCDFQSFPYNFSVLSGGEDAGWEQYFSYPCYDVNGADPCGEATRDVGLQGRREKGHIHMCISNLDTGDINLAGLTHYVENRITSEVWVGGYYGPLVCDGLSSKKTIKYADFGYIVYVFSPPAFSWVNPDTQETEYWNIYDERVAEGIIHPNRYLDIEEYVNAEINKIQIILDDDTGIEKMDATTGCAYPLAWYGYGITDGFILKP